MVNVACMQEKMVKRDKNCDKNMSGVIWHSQHNCARGQSKQRSGLDIRSTNHVLENESRDIGRAMCLADQKYRVVCNHFVHLVKLFWTANLMQPPKISS